MTVRWIPTIAILAWACPTLAPATVLQEAISVLKKTRSVTRAPDPECYEPITDASLFREQIQAILARSVPAESIPELTKTLEKTFERFESRLTEFSGCARHLTEMYVRDQEYADGPPCAPQDLWSKTGEIYDLKFRFQEQICSRNHRTTAKKRRETIALIGFAFQSRLNQIIFQKLLLPHLSLLSSRSSDVIASLGYRYVTYMVGAILAGSIAIYKELLLFSPSAEAWEIIRNYQSADSATVQRSARCFRAQFELEIAPFAANPSYNRTIPSLLKEFEELEQAIQTPSETEIHKRLRRTKILNTLAVIGNLTWGLPNTAVGAILSVVSAAVSPFRSEEIRKSDPFEITRTGSGKQIGVSSPLIRRSAVSLGLFQLYSHDQKSDAHEGGHAFQSAILGPLYLPSIGLTYLLHGEISPVDSWPEKWADRIGERTMAERPFSCKRR